MQQKLLEKDKYFCFFKTRFFNKIKLWFIKTICCLKSPRITFVHML